MKSMAFSGKRCAALLSVGWLLAGFAGCKSIDSQAAGPTRLHGGAVARPPSSALVSTSAPEPATPAPRSAVNTPVADPNFTGDTTAAWWGSPVVADTFGGNRLDPAKWVIYDSPNAAVNPRTSQATAVSDGRLHLTGGIYNGKDLSGGIASTLVQTYGRWEVRLRADRGVGYSAVALLWPEHMGVPEFAEIDFTEMIDPTRRTGGIYIHHGPSDDQAQNQLNADFTKWHVVAVDWLPDRLTFWLDGKPVWTYRGPLIPHRDRMGLALQNDQVCDRGPGFCRVGSTPKWVHMDVDWVRIYRAPQAG